jgi:hypothetical protein
MKTGKAAHEDQSFLVHFTGSQRVLIVESEPFTPHLETGMEIARRLDASGIEEHYLLLQYPIGTFGKPRWPITFGGKSVDRLLGKESTVHEHILTLGELEIRACAFPDSIGAIREYAVDDVNLGLGALSSTVHSLKKVFLESTDDVATAKHS